MSGWSCLFERVISGHLSARIGERSMGEIFRGIGLLLLSLVAGLPLSARAQQSITLKQLDVALWPEYDRPEMLVIYRLELAPEVNLPVDLAIRMPVAAGNPNAVAARQLDGMLLNLAYQRRVEGEWAIIEFTTNMPEVQVEYYDPSLSRDGARRHYEYHWPGDYAVHSLNIQVQQPHGVAEIAFQPVLGLGTAGDDNLIYYGASLGAYSRNQRFDLVIDYEKPSDTLTVEVLTVQPSLEIDDATAGRVDFADALPWSLALLGALLLAGGGWWLWRRSPAQSPVPPQPRRTAPEAADSSDDEDKQAIIYCHQCGKRAGPRDRFCRSCGTELQV